jgi:fucose permease
MAPQRSNPASGAQFVQHGYSPWAPKGLLGRTDWAGAAALACGLAALLLAAFSVLAGLAWLAALVCIAFALAVLFPRAGTAQKVASAVGVASALVAMGLLVT